MLATRVLLSTLVILAPGFAVAGSHGQGVSQYRNGPFNEFDLKAIGVALVVVMIVLGIRAVKRWRS